jgi:hypothetical protein
VRRHVDGSQPLGELGEPREGEPGGRGRELHAGHGAVEGVQRLPDQPQGRVAAGHGKRLGHRRREVGVVAEQHRHRTESHRDPQRRVGIPPVAAEPQRAQDVVAFRHELLQPPQLLGAPEMRFGG